MNLNKGLENFEACVFNQCTYYSASLHSWLHGTWSSQCRAWKEDHTQWALGSHVGTEAKS